MNDLIVTNRAGRIFVLQSLVVLALNLPAHASTTVDSIWPELAGGPWRGEREVISKWGSNSEEYWLWWGRERTRFRVDGLKFWRLFPNDPRRFVWLMQTVRMPPPYWHDERQGAAAYVAGFPEMAQVDRSAQGQWFAEYSLLRAEFMLAPDLREGWSEENVTSEGLRRSLRMAEWEQFLLNDLRYAARRGERKNLEPIAIALLDFLNSNEQPAESLVNLFLTCADDQPYFAAGFLSLLKESGSLHLSRLATGLQRRLDMRREPMELKLYAMDGRTVDLSKYRGKIVLLDIWSSSCSACIKSFPRIKSVYERYRDKGFDVVGVCMDRLQNRSLVESILAKHSLPWPTAWVELDQQWRRTPLAEELGITGVPVYFLLDREGKLVATDVSGPRLEKVLRKMLQLAD